MALATMYSCESICLISFWRFFVHRFGSKAWQVGLGRKNLGNLATRLGLQSVFFRARRFAFLNQGFIFVRAFNAIVRDGRANARAGIAFKFGIHLESGS